MRVAIGADHLGLTLKNELVDQLAQAGFELLDLGAHACDPADDYTDSAFAVAQAVVRGEAERGIVLCGSGVGACIAANKVRGARACLCHDHYTAHQGVEHDDLNVLCLGAQVVGKAVALELALAFLRARFDGAPRRVRRLDKVRAMERGELGSAVG